MAGNTCAIAAPTKMASTGGAPHAARMAQPMMNGATTPQGSHEGRRPSELQQFVGLHLQADAEEQEHDTQIAQGGQEAIAGDPVQHAGPDEHAGENLAEDTGLPDSFKEIGQQLGRGEDGEERQRNHQRFVRSGEQQQRRRASWYAGVAWG